jgi:hypothetical protein
MREWKHIELTDNELKTLVKDVYDAKVFTSLHIREFDVNMLGMVFLPAFFINTPPTEPRFPEPIGNIKTDRKNKLLHFDDLENWKKEMKEWEDSTDEREIFLKNIGMFYEENSKAGPRSINGYPIFYSCKIVSRSDTKKFLEMYRKYEELREKFENEWS